MRVVCLNVLLALALVASLAGGASPATPNTEVTNTTSAVPVASRQSRWKEDLDYFARELPARHVQFARIASREKFEREVREIERAVPELHQTVRAYDHR